MGDRMGDSFMATGFFLAFMLYFFFINMQTFNAIINNNFNTSCTELHARFENERSLRLKAKKDGDKSRGFIMSIIMMPFDRIKEAKKAGEDAQQKLKEAADA